MKIERFYDENLAHASYAILSEKEMAVIDPARDPQPYYEFAVKNKAKIKRVIETHPHADFVSGHLEIYKETDSIIYTSSLTDADYPHKAYDQGDVIQLGKVSLKCMHTPGHSPDSISVLLLDENGQEVALFSGDTLFIGDVGRPDLRENSGNTSAKREALARQMYDTIQNRLSQLKDETVVYPAHGAGSLCGKNISSDVSSTIGREKKENWAFQPQSEDEFVNSLLRDQPFIPKYFGYAVDMNKKGATSFENGVHGVDRISDLSEIPSSVLIVDVRNEKEYKKGHLPNSINIMLTDKGKFETWLGAIIDPSERFILLASSEDQLEKAIARAAKIGYEKLIQGAASVKNAELSLTSQSLDVRKFTNDPDGYSIVDVRNQGEVREGKYFRNSISIPLHDLREKTYMIPTDKPVVVHCAAGYRSAAGSSILENKMKDLSVYDLGAAIDDFK